jgi:uncharacterized cupin superfamily protein
MKPVVNIADVPMFPMGNDGAFEAKLGKIAPVIGSTGIGCMITIVPPGKKAFPFHVHHVIHELFVVIEGTGEYRFGDERYPIKTGDVLAAPAGKGKELAHQIINTGATDLKFLGISDMPIADVCEYPDSGKFALTSRFDWNNPGAGGIAYVGKVERSLEYFEGES